MSNRSLPDRYGDIKNQIDSLKEELAELREQVLDSGEVALTGEDWRITVSNMQREQLDTKIVRKFLTPEQVKEATRTISADTVRVRSISKITE